MQTLKQASFMPIHLIRVFGDLHYINKYEIAEEVLPYAKGFFNTNVKTVHRKLTAMPWIERVIVEKRWPNKLLIEIHEQQPLAIFNNQGIINFRGELIAVNVKLLSNSSLPVLLAHEHELQATLTFFHVLQSYLKKINLHVVRLENTIDIGWTANLNNNVKLVIGRDDLEPRLVRFVGLCKTKNNLLRKVSTVDLRYPNGVAIG
jgi:cell division protein FtsQ